MAIFPLAAHAISVDMIVVNTMDRRELLKFMAMTMGASLTLPESVFAKLSGTLELSDLGFFDEAGRRIVAELAETIIPRTDSPGAIDAGVPAWIELLVQDCLNAEDQLVIRSGLAILDEKCAARFQKPFIEIETGPKIEVLTEMENSGRNTVDSAFIRQFKDLTKLAYASSEAGATQAFEFVFVPGRWDPSLDLKPGQKAFAM